MTAPHEVAARRRGQQMKIRLDNIDLDVSIQCRAAIDTGTVNDYAERMTEGDKFPPIIVFGTDKRSWIGDGWHRVMAARQIDARQIDADLHPGGRINALKYALSSNALHGNRRTNADKRRCVEIALREFPKLSSRAIAEMCGVGPDLVIAVRPQVSENDTSKRTGSDGKQYPAHREPVDPPTEQIHHEEEVETLTPRPVLGPSRLGMQYAWIAVKNLESIKPDDAERVQAFAHVKGWLENHGA